MKPLNSSTYPAIFKRKSTRNYSDSPIPKDTLDKLREFMSEVSPLLPSEQAAFDIQAHKGSTMKIAAYAKSEVAACINMAFMLQQMDLFLQTNGFGALWNATVRATEKQYQGLPYRICLVFGVAKESPVRTDISQFDRKQREEIADKPELPVVEAVRLAPSARNRQYWYLACQDDCIDFYCKQGGFLDNSIMKNLQWIDMGLALCHAVLALQQEGFSPTAEIKPDAPKKEGYIYGISLNY